MPETEGEPRGKLRFVDVETARAARGVRLALLVGLPSPWSDGARALFATKGIDVLAVRYLPGDRSVTSWTGVPNAPAVMVDDERARSGWAEIIALAERLGPAVPLVPPGAAARARMFGLLHELLDEGGVAWSRRLLILDESFRPEDPTRPRRGFPLPLAQGLAARYGYAPERVPAAKARLVEALDHLDRELRAGGGAAQVGPYFFGATLTALDLYAAAAMAALVPPDEALRPIMPVLRPIFDHLDPEIAAAVTPALRAHRDRVYARHIGQQDA